MAKNQVFAGYLESLPVPFPGLWPRSLRNQEDVPWLLGKGAGKGQLGHPGSLDSGSLEAGLLVGAITGPRPGLPGARGESLICLDFLELQRFLGMGSRLLHHFPCPRGLGRCSPPLVALD